RASASQGNSVVGCGVSANSKALPQRTEGARGKAWLLMVCAVLVVIAPLRGWAQGSEPAQNPGQSPGQSSGQTAGKELPDAPGESKKKEQSGNPVEAVAGMTVG